jgi:hypothetical protein
MNVAKASQQDIEKTTHFLRACELFWDNRPNYSMRTEEREWMTLDDDDPEKLLILDIRQQLAKNENVEPELVDHRILAYEYLRSKYKSADARWKRVIMAADILIDNCCDPTEGHLAFYPGIELFHVAPEQ